MWGAAVLRSAGACFDIGDPALGAPALLPQLPPRTMPAPHMTAGYWLMRHLQYQLQLRGHLKEDSLDGALGCEILMFHKAIQLRIPVSDPRCSLEATRHLHDTCLRVS